MIITRLASLLAFVLVIGVSASPVERTLCCTESDLNTWLRRAQAVDVVVVGGGAAGLAATNTLLQHNVTNVVLLEAQSRLGGRIRTFRQGKVLVEDGAEWIHGDQRNRVYRIARSLIQLDEVLPDEKWDWRVVTEEGVEGVARNIEVLMALKEESKVNGVLKPFYSSGYGDYLIHRFKEEFPPTVPRRKGLLHYLHQLINYEEGTNSWLDISARDADQFTNIGKDFHWRNGYDTLVTHLKDKLPESVVQLRSPVRKVIWDSPRFPQQSLVVTEGGKTFIARHVLVTVSAAYLQKHHHTLFQPCLPNELLHNLEGVRLGVANKIMIGWNDPWWGPRPLSLDIIWSHFNLPPIMSWMYGIVNVFTPHRQRAILEMFVTGKNSTHMEELQNEQVQDHILYLLKNVTGQYIPQPTFFRRTRWSRDPWTLGSYSTYITTEASNAGLHHHSQLATPVKNSAGHTVLLWAGEHTHNSRYGTVDGAMDTGKLQAYRIVRLLKSSL